MNSILTPALIFLAILTLQNWIAAEDPPNQQKKAIIQLLLAAQEERGAKGTWLQLCYTVLRLVQFMIASPEKQLNHDSESIAEAAA